MAQERIPAKSIKDLEFCNYIIENILNNFGEHASRKKQKNILPSIAQGGF